MSNYGSPNSFFDDNEAQRCSATDTFPFELLNCHGLDVVRSFNFIYADTRVGSLVRDILLHTYEKFLGAPGEEFCRNALQDLQDYSRNLGQNGLAQHILHRREQFENSAMSVQYHGSYREQNLMTTIDLLGRENFRGIVADIGCDDNRLGHLIVANCSAARKVIGTDLHDPGHTTPGSSVEFRLAPDTATIPLDTNEADTVVIRYALHHMQRMLQQKILSEVRRILTPGGRLLILENSFSNSASARLSDELGFEYRTRVLDEAGLLTVLLTALDTFSLFIKDKFGPFPSTYRTPEEWSKLLSLMGFPGSYEYLGYPMHDLHQAPLTVLRCH